MPKKHFVCPRSKRVQTDQLFEELRLCMDKEIYVNYYENENEDVGEVLARRNEKLMKTDYVYR